MQRSAIIATPDKLAVHFNDGNKFSVFVNKYYLTDFTYTLLPSQIELDFTIVGNAADMFMETSSDIENTMFKNKSVNELLCDINKLINER